MFGWEILETISKMRKGLMGRDLKSTEKKSVKKVLNKIEKQNYKDRRLN